MPGVILQKVSPDSITVSMAASASQQPYDSPDEVGMRNSRDAREARKAARAAKNRQQNSSHYNGNAQSPTRDEYRYQDGDEPYSPTEDSVLQDSMLSSQQGGAVQQRGPEGRRGGESGSMPPGYPGPPGGSFEESPQSPTKNGHYRSQHQGSNLPSNRRHSANPGPNSGSGPYGQSRGGGSSSEHVSQAHRRSQAMTAQDAQLRPPPSLDDNSRQGGPNRRISRLESPSVLKSVLQPLEKKISEYDRLMTEARTEMSQLDDELRALQERRQQAEDRYLGAKSKHDDYARQHEDVGRAMRGELSHGLTSATMAGPPQHEPIQQQPIQRAVSFDERPLTPMSTHSTTKPRGSKLRFSLFGKH